MVEIGISARLDVQNKFYLKLALSARVCSLRNWMARRGVRIVSLNDHINVVTNYFPYLFSFVFEFALSAFKSGLRWKKNDQFFLSPQETRLV